MKELGWQNENEVKGKREEKGDGMGGDKRR